jgi:HEPN domain-containing protein
MNRNNLRDLSLIRLREARVLLRNGYYDGAYYLCGYAVESGLKACIAKKTKRHDFPDKNTVNESYTHDLTKLVKTAGLGLELDKEIQSAPIFDMNWSIVKDWSEASRYKTVSEKEARDLYNAVADKKYGVLQWLKLHW